MVPYSTKIVSTHSVDEKSFKVTVQMKSTKRYFTVIQLKKANRVIFGKFFFALTSASLSNNNGVSIIRKCP